MDNSSAQEPLLERTPSTPRPPRLRRLTSWRAVRHPRREDSATHRTPPAEEASCSRFWSTIWRLTKQLTNFFTSSPVIALNCFKSGFAVMVVALLVVFPPPEPFTVLARIAVWSVVTIDVLTEANVGLSHAKGVNRVLGALTGGLAALAVNRHGPQMGEFYPYFVLIMTFIGGYIPRYLKCKPPFKDDWAYAMTAGMITFHLLILVGYGREDRSLLPYLRFTMILVGFIWASVVNLAFMPTYAGDDLAKLVCKNFDTAGTILEKCVAEYCKGTELDHLPDIYSGKSVDDGIYQSYEEIFMSDSTVDKHLKAVYWEPPHGKYFWGYPWQKYDEVADYLRYTLHDVIALDSCLRAEIQAPMSLRGIFVEEMTLIASECGKLFRALGKSIKDMRVFHDDGNCVSRAQEAAVTLQHKIYLHTPLLLGVSASRSPRYSMYVEASTPHHTTSTANNSAFHTPDADLPHENDDDAPSSVHVPLGLSPGDFPGKGLSEGAQEPGQDQQLQGKGQGESNRRLNFSFASIPSNLGAIGTASGASAGRTEAQTGLGEGRASTGEGLGTGGVPGVHEGDDGGAAAKWPWRGVGEEDGYDRTVGGKESGNGEGREREREGEHALLIDGSGKEREEVEKGAPYTSPTALSARRRVAAEEARERSERQLDWQTEFASQGRQMGLEFDGGLERISALSFVKFASLLIELVAKVKFVVAIVDDLAKEAKFAP